jgi:RHS repeat-associated protein
MDQAYTYDRLNRLLTSQVGTLSGTTISGTPASEEDWTLDGLGNWPSYVQKTSGTVFLNQTRTATPANAISAMSATVGTTWVTPVYDLAGNMTGMPIPTNLTSLYTATYDAWNRLVSLGSGSTTVATYAYDGLNRRVVKGIYVSGTLDHNEHAYFNEKWQILEVRKEVSGTINSNPLEQHVWHTFYVDAPVLRDYDSATSGSPTRYYYAFDANYNVTAVTSAAGAPAERYYYSPYGTLLFLDASFNVLATQQTLIGNAQTYTGRQYDPESGLYFYRNRHYHSWLGMFCQRDSRGYADAVLNLYSYARLNPIVVTDPFGLCPCTYSGNQCCDYARANKLGGGAAAGIVCCQGTAIACVYDSGGFSHATDRVAQAIIDACLIAHEDSHLKDPNMLPCPDNCGIFSGGQMKQGTTMESECTAFTVEVECLDKLKGLCKNSRDPGKCEAQVAKEKQLANDEKGIYCGRGT